MTPLLLAVVLLQAPQPPHPIKVAVLDTQDVSGDLGFKAKVLTQIIVGEVSKNPQYSVMSSEQVAQLIGFDRQKQLLGCTDASCLAEIGGALGVKYLVSSEVGHIGSRYRIDLKLMEAGQGRLVAAAGDFTRAQDDELASAAVALVNKLMNQAVLGPVDPTRTAGDLAVKSPAGPLQPVSYTSAWVATGAAVILAAGAATMTAVTNSTYQAAVADYRNSTLAQGQSPNGQKLSWMSPLADGLWAATAVAAGAATWFFVTAGPAPAGAGGEIGLRGQF